MSRWQSRHIRTSTQKQSVRNNPTWQNKRWTMGGYFFNASQCIADDTMYYDAIIRQIPLFSALSITMACLFRTPPGCCSLKWIWQALSANSSLKVWYFRPSVALCRIQDTTLMRGVRQVSLGVSFSPSHDKWEQAPLGKLIVYVSYLLTHLSLNPGFRCMEEGRLKGKVQL